MWISERWNSLWSILFNPSSPRWLLVVIGVCLELQRSFVATRGLMSTFITSSCCSCFELHLQKEMNFYFTNQKVEASVLFWCLTLRLRVESLCGLLLWEMTFLLIFLFWKGLLLCCVWFRWADICTQSDMKRMVECKGNRKSHGSERTWTWAVLFCLWFRNFESTCRATTQIPSQETGLVWQSGHALLWFLIKSITKQQVSLYYFIHLFALCAILSS